MKDCFRLHETCSTCCRLTHMNCLIEVPRLFLQFNDEVHATQSHRLRQMIQMINCYRSSSTWDVPLWPLCLSFNFLQWQINHGVKLQSHDQNDLYPTIPTNDVGTAVHTVQCLMAVYDLVYHVVPCTEHTARLLTWIAGNEGHKDHRPLGPKVVARKVENCLWQCKGAGDISFHHFRPKIQLLQCLPDTISTSVLLFDWPMACYVRKGSRWKRTSAPAPPNLPTPGATTKCDSDGLSYASDFGHCCTWMYARGKHRKIGLCKDPISHSTT